MTGAVIVSMTEIEGEIEVTKESEAAIANEGDNAAVHVLVIAEETTVETGGIGENEAVKGTEEIGESGALREIGEIVMQNATDENGAKRKTATRIVSVNQTKAKTKKKIARKHRRKRTARTAQKLVQPSIKRLPKPTH